MSNLPQSNSQGLVDDRISLLRFVAAGWALFFVIGHLLGWVDLVMHRVDFYRDGNALMFPWLYLPFFASAGLAAGYALGGSKRPDLIGLYAQGAMAAEAVYFIFVVGMDLLTNPRPEYPAITKVFVSCLLGMVAVSAARNARSAAGNPWGQTARLVVSELPLVGAMICGSGAIEGWQKAWHDKLDGWGMFTTPVVLVFSVFAAAGTVVLVRSAWRMQVGRGPGWMTRILPVRS